MNARIAGSFRHATGLAALVASLTSACVAPRPAPRFLPPTPYLSATDSPFAGLAFTYFHLEDFEDGALNTPGVRASIGGVSGPGASNDSVDADDGCIDGMAPNAHSWYTQNRDRAVVFTFDARVLGALPTHAGIVWTDVGGATPRDGYGAVTMEAVDAQGRTLGPTEPVAVGDGQGFSTTGEDRFFGVISPAGIASLKIAMTNSTDWEMDHLQYGRLKGW